MKLLDTFSFKSNPDYFEKERDGVKNNTVRKIDLNDNRFIKLITYYQIGWNDGEIRIEIRCESVWPYRFERNIRDIAIWNDLMIITWEHEQTKGVKK